MRARWPNVQLRLLSRGAPRERQRPIYPLVSVYARGNKCKYTHTFELTTHEQNACPDTSSGSLLTGGTIEMSLAIGEKDFGQCTKASILTLFNHRQLEPKPIFGSNCDLRNTPPCRVDLAHELVERKLEGVGC